VLNQKRDICTGTGYQQPEIRLTSGEVVQAHQFDAPIAVLERPALIEKKSPVRL